MTPLCQQMLTYGLIPTATLTLGGATLLHNLPEAGLDVVLSFGLATLLFLVTEELLVEAYEGPEKPWPRAMFFAGFCCFSSSAWSPDGRAR